MKRISCYLLVLVCFIGGTSCRNSTSKKSAVATDNAVNYDLIKSASWLIGEWQNLTPDSKSTEIWHKENDSTYSAISYIVVLNDTVFYEKIDIVQRGKCLYYIPSVSDQNDAQPVEFKLISFSHQDFIFENPLHDFPQKIRYTRTGSDSLIAIISGRMEGKFSVQEFPMERVR